MFYHDQAEYEAAVEYLKNKYKDPLNDQQIVTVDKKTHNIILQIYLNLLFINLIAELIFNG